ncbi:hypothetical protein EPR50_G00233870 [Perca flavescens]|uniref:Uncharacterized protein n=1 Tax=Perca flavescens TaxID=8167 RepID=A0A484C7B5_PERFV|nr:hypothetical protein EPR50_G00233870 [Perca flavescens]
MYMSAGGGISLPFTAIGAESLSSLGPLHCAAPLHQSSLRPDSEASLETQLRWQTSTTKTRLRLTRQIWRMWRKWKKRKQEKMKTAKLVS